MEKYDEIMALFERTAKEVNIRAAEADKRSAIFDAKLDRLEALYGGVSDNQGAAAEEFFFNSLSANPVIGGIKYDRVLGHVLASAKKGTQSEFDLVLVNGNSIAVVEVKHKAHLSTIDQLEKQLKRYREIFPEHASYKLYGGIAGMSVPDEIAQEAHSRGLFVLKQQGNVITADTQAMRAF